MMHRFMMHGMVNGMVNRMVMRRTVVDRVMGYRMMRSRRRRRQTMVLCHSITGQRQGDQPNQ